MALLSLVHDIVITRLGRHGAGRFVLLRVAVVSGILAFLLNYIPNVGSALACMLPVPMASPPPRSARRRRMAACHRGTVLSYIIIILSAAKTDALP